MKLTTRLSIGGAAVILGLAANQAAYAGGIELYEIATPDVGLASAGYTARAQDASTLFKNPAGMSLLEGTQVQGGLQLLYGSVNFNPDSGSSTSGGDGGNAIGAIPGTSFFGVTDVTDRLKVGFGSFSYFGLAEDYDDGWTGRYYVQDSTLLGLSLMPAASVKVTDWLSVGGGPNVMYGYLKNKTAVNTPVAPGDGTMKLKDHDWGVGGVGGVLVEPVEGTRIGVTYVSQVKLNFSDRPNFSGVALPTPRLDLGVTVPQGVMVGVYHELSPKWAVMGDVGWQNWERFGRVEVEVYPAGGGSPSTTKDLNYQDTWHGALGAQYTYSEQWRFSAGVAYDSSAVKNKDRGVLIPMGQVWRFGLGAEWQASQKLSLGAAYEFAWMGDMSVHQGDPASNRGRVSGSYNDAWMSFFTLSLTYKF